LEKSEKRERAQQPALAAQQQRADELRITVTAENCLRSLVVPVVVVVTRSLLLLLLLWYNIYFNFDFFLAFSPRFVRRYPLFCMPLRCAYVF